MTADVDYSPMHRVLETFSGTTYLLASSYDDSRRGVVGKWIQPCGWQPPMIMLAVSKGHSVAPLIRDSRRFCISLLREDAGHLGRRFDRVIEPGEDPFVGLPVKAAPSGSPYLTTAHAIFDCELSRHIDIDSDHELYVGLVQHAEILD